MTCSVDGEEDWPGDEATEEADDDEDLEEAQDFGRVSKKSQKTVSRGGRRLTKVAIHGVMAEDIRVRDGPKRADPSRQAVLKLGALLVFAKGAQGGPRLVDALDPAAEPEEDGDVGGSDGQQRDQGAQEAAHTVGAAASGTAGASGGAHWGGVEV